MDVKKIITFGLTVVLLFLSFNRLKGKGIPESEVSRLSDSLAVVSCGDDLQHLIPIEGAATNNLTDGINAIAAGDPNAAAEITNLIKTARPGAIPSEAKIDSAKLLKILDQSFKRQGWSMKHASEVMQSQKRDTLRSFADVILQKMKIVCPHANPKSNELVNTALEQLYNSDFQ